MSAPKLQTKRRSSYPSPVGVLRRSAGSPTEQQSDSPPLCRGTSRRARGGRRARSYVSPLERSGSTRKVVNRVADDSRDGDGHWLCDGKGFHDEDGGGSSLEEARRGSWVWGFLAQMGETSPDNAGDPAAAMLCPACKGGPGGWPRDRGFLQALQDHVRSVMAKRMKLHRQFAAILEAGLRTRKRNQDKSSRSGKAERLADGLAGDWTIPWPPMVVVLNTRLGKHEGSGKWAEMGNRVMLASFREYEPVKARSTFSIHGRGGASLLIFDATLRGYLQAQRLHSQFIQEGRGKHKWHEQKPWNQAAKKRLLYGYMATREEELCIFSTHPGDKDELKYEMKPYQVVVGDPITEMYGRSQNRASQEKEIVEEIEHYKSLERTCEQRGQEIEAIRRMLNEQSDEHNEQIESMNEHAERLCSKLRESELLLKKMQEQITSPRSAAGDGVDGVAGSTCQLVKSLMNHSGDGEHGKLEEERLEEVAEEQRYLAATCGSGSSK